MRGSSVLLGDGGFAQINGFGARRLKVLLELSRHPELDDLDWRGNVQLHFGKGISVQSAIHPAAREIESEGAA